MTQSDKLPVALVTGGSGGIGRAICRRLAADGYLVVINFHSRPDAACEMQSLIEKEGGEACTLRADVTQEDQVRNLIGTIDQQFGRLDVLVNNAGRTHEALFLLTPLERFRKIIQDNFISVVLCCQAALRIMLRQHSGVIVNISSASAFGAHVGLSAYAASKAALNAVTAVLAKEVAAKGIRVNAIAPSWVETDMIKTAVPEVIQKGVQRIPLRRVAKPEEVAAMVSALCQDDLTYLIGQVILLDGGGGR